MASAPIHHHLNQTGQDVFTYASWGLTFVLLAVAIQMGRKERTPFYFMVVLSSMVAAFAEPLYDEGFSLYFYADHGLQTFFTAFDVPQPVWTHSGYAILYGAPAIYMVWRIGQGTLTRSGLLKVAAVEFLMSCTFEMIGINAGTYTYWGPHVFRVLQYPIVIGVLETAQVMCFGIAAARLRARARGPLDLMGIFVIFPVTFFGANFGAGAAVIVAIHAQNTNKTIVTLCTLVSIACAGLLIRLAASFLPEEAPAAAPAATAEGSAEERMAALA
ncbi:hypothetical protein NBH00_03990 [Paraconexibacter antarcticus]|uniref:Rhodopsin n=1 Tax=Paraconexibacter antarcticus TaxID=2949664 RepID=A0ABY5DTN0_9ACTN|nr:hypothetical protein [Paraconexibacter antarcticus]UTI65378.1 hypothetical protein NBH00_03990 [Paraconexibacter antarcticus]